MKKTKTGSVLTMIQDLLKNSKTFGPVLMALLVGILAGFGGILFRYIIETMKWLFFDVGGRISASIPNLSIGDAYVIVLPAIGITIVSWMINRWATEARGHGVPEVQYAVKKKGGHIQPRVGIVKAFASAITIGSGGSVGREGPIVQIGCALGSSIGQLAGLRESGIKLMVACGAAAAVGGTFNAPIAGVIFALEVILGNFGARSFGLVVIASVTSTAVNRAFLGKAPAFILSQPFVLESMWEFPLYLMLGISIGALAVGYTKSVYFFEDRFENWKIPATAKAIIGGLLVGCMGYFGSDYLFGVGYAGIEHALEGQLTLQVLLMLVVLKILATSLTLAAGGSGGVFAPALFIGAMIGSAFGIIVNQLFPSITAPAGAYAIVGMAALFAGAAHAPITSILIVFEMTDDYKIILPLMLAVVVSHLVASWLNPDSIYTIKLRRRGGLMKPKAPVSLLDTIVVTDAMTTEYQTVHPKLPITDLIKQFNKNRVRSWSVIDDENKLAGIVTVLDVEKAIMHGEADGAVVADIMTTNLIYTTPDESLRSVLRRVTGRDVYQIPVVATDDNRKLLGMLRRREIIWAYNELAADHNRLLTKTGVDLESEPKDSVQIEVHIETDYDQLCYHKIRDIKLPRQSIIALLRRADHAVIPRGDTVIEPGDSLLFLTTSSHERQLRKWISSLGKQSKT